jgi:polysaccharide pyruvyl transferase WcaK-like protein
MIESVTLLGSSSGRNAGDAALISGITDTIDSLCGRRLLYEVPTVKPGHLKQVYHHRIRPIGMMPWHGALRMLGLPTFRSIMRTDLTLVFDAILFDRSFYNPMFNFLSSLAVMLPLAKRKGKLLGCYNVGVGPISTATGARALKRVLDVMDFITVRDQDSYRLLRSIGVTNSRVLVTADAALNVPGCGLEEARSILSSLGLPAGEEILAINVNAYIDTWAPQSKGRLGRERFTRIYSEALTRFLRTNPVPVLYVCTQYHDVSLTRYLMAHVSSTRPMAILSNRRFNHFQIKGVLALMSMLFSMRLHAMILSTSAFTPTIALEFQKKVRSYLRSLGLEQFCLSFDDFSVESVLSHLLVGWQQRAMLRETLVQKIPVLQRDALKAGRIVAGIDAGMALDETLSLEAS